MSKRAFLIAGPESSGNRIMASLLVRSGVHGAGSTNQLYSRERLPDGETSPVLTIIHHDIRDPILKLGALGYEVTVIVMMRDPFAQEQSMVQRGHVGSIEAAHQRVLDTYAENFATIKELGCKYRVVSYDYLVTYTLTVLHRIVTDLELPFVVTGPIHWDDQPYDHVVDANARHYGLTAKSTRIRTD